MIIQKFNKLTICWFLAFLGIALQNQLGKAQETQLSGTVNEYAAVLEMSDCTLRIVGNPSLEVGQKILIIQMKGATVNYSSDSDAGAILNYGSSGLYEINQVAFYSQADGLVRLSKPLLNRYDTQGRVQLVALPNINGDARVSGNISAPAWDGTTGGVVALDLTGILTLDADIHAGGKGFRGGRASVNNAARNQTAMGYSFSSGLGGEKGEGIAEPSAKYQAGRGPLANGGGGGNASNSGGAGGSNLTLGGKGGYQYNEFGSLDIGGLPGQHLLSLPEVNRIFLGGGGGGGQQNDDVGTSGSNGGGIVIIRATAIIGNNHTIAANGDDKTDIAGRDAPGGGGAGGTIILDTDAIENPLHINLKGGDGGKEDYQRGCKGPGGGGSGGVLLLKHNSLVNALNINTNGGDAGWNINQSSPFANSRYGAQAGENGVVFGGVTVPLGSDVLYLTESRDICRGDSLVLNVPEQAKDIVWWNNDTDRRQIIRETGVYWVEYQIDSLCGRIHVSYDVKLIETRKPKIVGPSRMYPGLRTTLDVDQNYAGYLWSTGSKSKSAVICEPGMYWVQVTDDQGCRSADTVSITESIEEPTLAGQVNSYAAVLSIDGNKVIIEPGTGFCVGQKVLLIQMKGANILQGNDNRAGDILEYGSCGYYEINKIAAIDNDGALLLETPLNRQYDVSASVQLISFADISRAKVTGSVSAPVWNGRSGGVVFLDANERLELEAPILADGRGFRGGRASQDNAIRDLFGYGFLFSSGQGGEKGEGIAGAQAEYQAGRGPLANGGGGGNAHNSGGGGGSNLSPGGKGGYQFNEMDSLDIGGLPGSYLVSLPGINRIFMGGGGGGGHQNDGVGTDGSAGGGIIIIRTKTLMANNMTLSANGANITAIAGKDGAGGGGAGGTIVLSVDSIRGHVNINLQGADGGTIDYQRGCKGPGGGGSGGVLLLSDVNLWNSMTADLRGGVAGWNMNTGSPFYNARYGAEAGEPGIIFNAVRVPVSVREHYDMATTSVAVSPNPAGHATNIRYTLTQDRGTVQLSIRNILGQEVWSIDRGTQTAGEYMIQWDARNSSGAPVAPGVYFVNVTIDSQPAATVQVIVL